MANSPSDSSKKTSAEESAQDEVSVDKVIHTKEQKVMDSEKTIIMTDDDKRLENKNRSKYIAHDLKEVSKWALRIIFIAIAAFLIYKLIGFLWVGILPTLLAILVCSALWPPVNWLIKHKVPSWLASAGILLLCLGIVAGILSAIAPRVAKEIGPLSQQAVKFVRSLQDRLMEPPFNMNQNQLDDAVNYVIAKIQSSASTIASMAINGVGAAGSALVTLLITLVLCFFFLKDGAKLMPWMNRTIGYPAMDHIGEILNRSWKTLGGFIRTQGIVSAIDATFIGLGMVILGVPLAGPLAIITFMGGFIPIVGAFVSGFLAIAVAIIGVNLKAGIILFIIVLVVQQLEGNVLSPLLQSNAMNLHPVIVLLVVSAGGTLYSIVGAFLAVPVAAVIAVILRYWIEQWDKRAELPTSSHSVDDNEDDDDNKIAEWVKEHTSALREKFSKKSDAQTS